MPPQEQDELQYPSFQSRLDAQHGCGLSLSYYRLRWSLFGPLTDRITVLKDATDHNSPIEPFMSILPSGDISFHPITEESLTELPISSVSVSIDELLEFYCKQMRHALDFEEELEEEFDFDAEPEELLVLPTNRPYITIGDYVVKVHEWMNDLQDSILAALEGLYGALPGDVDRGRPEHYIWPRFLTAKCIFFNEENNPGDWEKYWQEKAHQAKAISEARQRRSDRTT